MPSATYTPPPLPHWVRHAKTTYSSSIPWANLSVIDLSTFDATELLNNPANQKLAEQLQRAVHEDGFFSVVGHGLSDEEVQRQYDIGQAYFKQSKEEKTGKDDNLRCDFGKGNYFGYRGYNEKKIMGTNVMDNVESVNIPKYIPELDNEPRGPFLKRLEPEIEDFSRRALGVAHKIFVLFALILELPADYFTSRHLYEDKSEDHLRYMLYHPRTVDDDARVEDTWSRSHTDFGSLTLLWSQNVAGLQIKPHAASPWQHVRPVDGGIICNVGDTLSFWSAGYLKSTVHRVIRPPPDQAALERLGLFYFVRPGDEVDIKPAASPLLQRLGLVGSEEERKGEKPVKGFEYVRARVKDYHDHKDYADKRGQKFRVGNLEIEDQVA